MDKIWDRIRRSLAVVVGMKKTEWSFKTDKSRTLNSVC